MAVDEKVKEISEKLEQGLKEVFDSDKYKNYLNTMSKFHNYSLNNTLLINQQAPDATRVAGYESWNKNFNRQVKKGEKGIKIIAPAPYNLKVDKEVKDAFGQPVMDESGKPKTEQVEIKIPAFKVTTVFDVSQTVGEPLPELGVKELMQAVEGANDFKEMLNKISPVPVEFGEIDGSAKGFFDVQNEKIMIQDGMSDAQTIKTMIHEISHAKLHNMDEIAKNKEEGITKNSQTKEVEAESVAYIVCQHFGIDTSDYSFGYIAGWSEDKGIDELKGSMNTIRDTAAEIINRVEGGMRFLDKERQAEKANEEQMVAPEKMDDVVVTEGSEGPATPETPKAEDKPQVKEEKAEAKEQKETSTQEKRPSLRDKLNEKKAEVKAKDKGSKDVTKNRKKVNNREEK